MREKSLGEEPVQEIGARFEWGWKEYKVWRQCTLRCVQPFRRKHYARISSGVIRLRLFRLTILALLGKELPVRILNGGVLLSR